MICYSKISLTEGIDLTKNKNSKMRIVCHYWYFSHWVQINGCDDLLIMSPDTYNVAISTVKSDDYHCINYGVSISDKIYLLERSVLNDREVIKTEFQRN